MSTLSVSESRFFPIGRRGRRPSRADIGFTLIELLVVIAIIAILAGLLLGVITTARNKAQEASECSFLRQLSLAAKIYKDDWGNYFDTRYQSGRYRITPTSVLKACNLSNVEQLRDPWRKDRVQDFFDFAAMGMKNSDWPPDGYGRVFLNFADRYGDPLRSVLFGTPGDDAVATSNAMWPKLKLPADTQFLWISAGADGVIDMDPAKDLMYLYKLGDENPQRWRGQ